MESCYKRGSWAKNMVSKTIHTPLRPMNLLILLIRITGKNDRQTSDIKAEMLQTYQDLYFTINLMLSIL